MQLPNLVITKDGLFRVFYSCLLCFTALYLVLAPFMPSYVTLLRLPSLLVVMCIAGTYVILRKYNLYEIAAVLIIFFIILLNCLLYPETITGETMYRTAGFVALVMLIFSSNAVHLDTKTIRLTYIFCIFCVVIFFGYSFSSFAHWDTKRYISALTLGFNNPNFTGMLLFFLFSLLFICRPPKFVMLSYVFELIVLYLLFKTQSRTSFLSALLILLLCVLIKPKPLPKGIIMAVSIIPFLFVKGYLELYGHLLDGGIFLGKELFTGRERVYARYLDHIQTPLDYLIGHAQDEMFANAHNGPLAIFVSIGILGSICFFGILFYKLFTYNRAISNREAAAAILVLLACFVNSCGEAAAWTGGFPLLIFVYITLVFANYKEAKD